MPKVSLVPKAHRVCKVKLEPRVSPVPRVCKEYKELKVSRALLDHRVLLVPKAHKVFKAESAHKAQPEPRA